MFKTGISLFFISAFIGCRSQQPQTTILSRNDSTTLLLEANQNVFLKREQINLTFERIIEDSRCPEGVQCVWDGVAAVELTVVGTFTRPQTLSLATTDLPDKSYLKTVVFNGYSIRLDALTPYPSKICADSLTRKPTAQLTIKPIK
ncbi:hypothetical protein [Sphingobacterium deserti]|uniref:Lipoprotein n=1 Tax=Sphingobacterium deserti TaxID=1229276 RepID=A0A0B8SZR4_9SPHI|nr:hypothetical protein [Sphingobacterium deserti]KGE13131.1 hypothetical protein DI53_3100 [Sphingobacterium deserti]